MPAPSEAARPTLRIALGMEKAGGFDTGVPVLAGDAIESLFPPAARPSRSGCVTAFEAEGWLVGAATVPLGEGLEAATHAVYLDMLRATRGLHLARIWNYVPAINEIGPGALENYRLFCRGRARAFEQHHGAAFKSFLPSASAVGRRAGELTVVFAAAPGAPRHIENPRQVPAYDYPLDYGPRPPSFARATIVPAAQGDTVFISGTSAIRGHATVAPHRTPEQLECTLENLRTISAACGLGANLGAGPKHARHFKVYLRHASEQRAIATMLEAQLLARSDHVTYLRSDICRAELNVEIEAALWPR